MPLSGGLRHGAPLIHASDRLKEARMPSLVGSSLTIPLATSLTFNLSYLTNANFLFLIRIIKSFILIFSN